MGEYEVVGAGLESRAVHLGTKEVYECKVLTNEEALTIGKIVVRLNEAQTYYHGNDLDELS